MGRSRLVVLLGALFLPGSGTATTWANTVVQDPIDPDAECEVHEPASYGGYIYNWPEKYDQVFWPLTDRHGIWFCEGTGFTAFIGDFEDMSDDEKAAIAAYLEMGYRGAGSMPDRLRLLEEIYALRDKDAEFDNRLLRVLARWYQDLGDTAKANGYRKRALAQIEQRLEEGLPEDRKLEYLYLAANYTMLFGDTEASRRYMAELKAAIDQLQDQELRGFAEYLEVLVEETPRIVPGGKLDPAEHAGG